METSRRVKTEKSATSSAIVFFDCNGLPYEFLPQGINVKKEYFLEVLRRLHEAIRQERLELRKNQSWILHHDNAPSHTSMLVREFFAKNKIVIMPLPSYSALAFSSSQD